MMDTYPIITIINTQTEVRTIISKTQTHFCSNHRLVIYFILCTATWQLSTYMHIKAAVFTQ